MTLYAGLQKEIYQFLKARVIKKIEEYDLNDDDAAKPFQYALFTKKGYLAKGFIHGCETALGSWHESVAQIIASHRFEVARKLQGKDKLTGNLPVKAQHVFDQILSDLDSVKREPNAQREAEEIAIACKSGGQTVTRTQTVDLYLQTADGEEIYLEIKGPKPNKNEMRAAKRDLLEILAMKAQAGERIRVYLGMYYNPYAPAPYQRWTCLKFFQPGGDFLVGKQFWDFLGGVGAYEDLIAIYERVGEEVRPVLEKKFGQILRSKAIE